jgi:hypothetical protein
VARGILFVLLALVATAAVLLAGGPPAVAQAPVTGILSGPNAIAPGAGAPFFLNASGGPASEDPNGTFSIRYYVTGPDPAGAVPLQSTPGSASGNASGRFQFNITAPQKEQVITLVVEINSTAASRSERTTVTHALTVVTPIVLRATFHNGGGAAAMNVTVKFYIDGKLAGTSQIPRVDPRTNGTATLSYLPVGLAPGTHSVRVEADLNKNGVIEADKGEVAIVDVFYKKDFELTWPYVALIMAATISVSSLVVRARRRRR